ncbi:quaternary amine ABC transporter ATP-binding protein [Sedimentisphaera salicampi]|uniref:Glycine betaine/carnitine transport ATP-binding protein GbuA n=1 Tax=Sedimentisphaera salicampi TaxID=1941349 RepID=A0A1W6LM55_9BACT|nr:glycine betaine/L-proline ABC transporter ATP-binding protein [Sedimentisphaera salicampi]ARN56824.1 Glycine betaine/carnitine transport ATP-binding protein GbuA [Sedimentisphaera salicampi]OXU15001.1 Glycine betaine/carnitine transport ATP-binding protein GbuA [Sedimentisphaera salicampi]
MSVIQVKNLFKVFGRNPSRVFPLIEKGMNKEEILAKTGCTIGVNDASFEVQKGETFVIMGLSGSGKSTLVRCLNRLISPTRGSVIVDDKDIMDLDQKNLNKLRSQKMSMVFQHFGLLPHKNVLNNVAFGLEIRGVEKNKRYELAEKAVKLVGLTGYEDSKTAELSGGMQQRVGLARALAADTDIILMDEAFSALDPLIRTNMQDELLELQAKMHKTIVFITHDLDEALKLGDRIAIMKDGFIEQIGTPEDILIAPASQYIRDFVENVDRSKVITAKTVMRKPEVIASHKDGPAQALRQMERSGLSTLFVVNENREFIGHVKIDDAIRLSKENKKKLDEIIIKDAYTSTPDTAIAEMIPAASETALPIPVISEDGHFEGIVTRASILAAMSSEGDNNES